MQWVILIIVGGLFLVGAVVLTLFIGALALWVNDCRSHRAAADAANRWATFRERYVAQSLDCEGCDPQAPAPRLLFPSEKELFESGKPKEAILSDDDCDVRICRAKDCNRSILDGEIFCGFCAARLPVKLRDLMAIARAENKRVALASLVRLARELLADELAGVMTLKRRQTIDPDALRPKRKRS